MRSDLDKATSIVTRYRKAGGMWIGPHGQVDKNVASVVAEGIALGRNEGLELAQQLITSELGKRSNAKRP